MIFTVHVQAKLAELNEEIAWLNQGDGSTAKMRSPGYAVSSPAARIVTHRTAKEPGKPSCGSVSLPTAVVTQGRSPYQGSFGSKAQRSRAQRYICCQSVQPHFPSVPLTL